MPIIYLLIILSQAMSAAQREKLPPSATSYFTKEQWAAINSYVNTTNCNHGSSDHHCNNSPGKFMPYLWLRMGMPSDKDCT